MVDVIILSLERPEKTIACVKSLGNANITIIDNGSCEATIKQLKKLPARLKCMDRNVGVGSGRNYGVLYTSLIASMPYLIHLDNDMTVEYDFIWCLFRAMQHYPKAAAVGAKVIKDNKIQLCGRHIVDNKIDYSRDNMLHTDARANVERKCDLMHGGATMYRRSALDKLIHDETYFIGYEDLDMMMQFRALGYDLVYCPSAVAYHSPDFTGDYALIRRDKRHIQESKKHFEAKWGIKT